MHSNQMRQQKLFGQSSCGFVEGFSNLYFFVYSFKVVQKTSAKIRLERGREKQIVVVNSLWAECI